MFTTLLRFEMAQVLFFGALIATALAGQAQFYQASDQLGIALATSTVGNDSIVHLHIEAPTAYQWAAIGTGDKMDGSFMLLIQHSASNTVHVTARSSTGHDEPKPLDVSIKILNSHIQDNRMLADIQWMVSDSSAFSSINPSDSKQPWIWAVGPRTSSGPAGSDDSKRRDGSADGIEQHSSYGTFFADMRNALQTSNTTLTLTGTSNIAVTPQGGSYRALVVLHALLLGVAFVIVFPLGAIGLRTQWSLAFTVHWVLQLVASAASLVGLAVAIALSIIGIEYNDFDETHQILGFCVVALLVAQLIGGIWHHINFKRFHKRTAISYGHMILGRILIYGGMANAILGCLLADDNTIAYVIAGVAFVLACMLEYISWKQRQRTIGNKSVISQHEMSSDLPLRQANTDESPNRGNDPFRN